MHYALSMKMCLSVQKRLCLNLSPYSIFFFLVSRLPKRFCWTRSSHVQEIFFKIFVKISQKLFTRLCSKIFAPICFERPFRQPWTEYSHLPGKSHLNLSSTKQRATGRNDIIMQAPEVAHPKIPPHKSPLLIKCIVKIFVFILPMSSPSS